MRSSLRYCAVAAILLLAGVARADFIAPTDLTPYKPVNNPASVIKVKSTATLDIYVVQQSGVPFAVGKGTDLTIVVVKAQLSLAWIKLLAATGLTFSTSITDLQAANTWFAINVEPLY